ncbi:HK97 family phage prohead protease [Candidatus Pacearchaeota archaeon]|nr:HK97 family phage prohead protease [Candidatus Pacearchaeota archaeon]
METKYLNVPFEMKAIEEDEDFFYFEGYASTFGNVDLGDDIVERGAFLKTLKKRTPKLLWQHKMSEPLGVFEEALEDDRGLFVRGKMPKADSFVSGRVIPQMKTGSINSMSIGFSVVVDEFDRDAGIRRIKEVVLFEASLVTIPMNPQAVVTGMKALEDKIEGLKTIKDVNNYLKECGLSKKQTEGILAKMRDVIKECNALDAQRKSEEEIAELIKSNILSIESLKTQIKGE